MSKQLVSAAQAGDAGKVAALLAGGADVNWTANLGARRTALAEAALGGHCEVVRLLVASGADLNLRDRGMGMTPLGWACHSGHLETVRVLIESGADLNLPTPNFLLSPLMCAAISGHEDVVRMLLDAGVDVHAQTADGRNALVCAKSKGRNAIMALLKERGAVYPAPVVETFIPWPEVGDDLSLVDYARPESVLRAFILSMHRWEVEAVAHGSNLDWNRVRADYDKAFAPYCTPKERKYGGGRSVASPPRCEPEEALTAVTVKGARAELTTVQRHDRPVRYENLYVMVRKGGRWLVDSRKDRCVGLTAWKTSIL